MYEELVQNLRDEAHILCDYVSKSKYHKAGKRERIGLAMREAADAIEELERQLAEYKKYDSFLALHGCMEVANES